jgi:hypothetical protein
MLAPVYEAIGPQGRVLADKISLRRSQGGAAAIGQGQHFTIDGSRHNAAMI